MGKWPQLVFFSISVTFFVFLIYLNTCYHLHVYQHVLTLFQFLFLSHCCRMHELILHEWSSIQWLASPTCMLIFLMNLSFMFACTVNQFCFHLVLPCIQFHIFFQLPINKSSQPWPRICLHRDNIAQSTEGRICLPLQKCAFLPSHCPPELFWVFLRDSDWWPRKLCNAIPKHAVTPSWNYTLRNPNSQHLVWIVHCVDQETSLDCALCRSNN